MAFPTPGLNLGNDTQAIAGAASGIIMTATDGYLEASTQAQLHSELSVVAV